MLRALRGLGFIEPQSGGKQNLTPILNEKLEK